MTKSLGWLRHRFPEQVNATPNPVLSPTFLSGLREHAIFNIMPIEHRIK